MNRAASTLGGTSSGMFRRRFAAFIVFWLLTTHVLYENRASQPSFYQQRSLLVHPHLPQVRFLTIPRSVYPVERPRSADRSAENGTSAILHLFLDRNPS
jgi:hypothetical protein